MKQLLIILIFAVFLFSSCREEDVVTLTESGNVVDYSGVGSCGIVIELDNGGQIQPLYYPEGFTFSQGQRVLVEYTELDNVIPTCGCGIASDVSYIEELSCAAYADLYDNNYDSLACDPVYIHEVFVDGNCLQIKLSYGGGCQEHSIGLVRMHMWETGNASMPAFLIRHDANGDMCEAWFTKELRFDLSPLLGEGKTKFVLKAKMANDETYSCIFDLND